MIRCASVPIGFYVVAGFAGPEPALAEPVCLPPNRYGDAVLVAVDFEKARSILRDLVDEFGVDSPNTPTLFRVSSLGLVRLVCANDS